MAITELYLEDALKYISEKHTKLVWIGIEPVDYIAELLQLDRNLIEEVSPGVIIKADKTMAERYKDHVFVCYHGVSSHYVAQALKEKYGFEYINLKGGVTAIVGEIF